MTNRNILLLVDEIFEKKKKNKSVEYKITLQKNRKAAAAFEKNRDVSMVNYIIYPSPPGPHIAIFGRKTHQGRDDSIKTVNYWICYWLIQGRGKL